MSKRGHNSKVQAGPIAGDRLKSFVERIEKMEEERKAIAGDIRDIYAEAKGVGYDVKTVRWVVQERRLDAADRAERDTLRDVYQHALDTAVGLVRGGLSLREAGRITGASKSSIHRALAVPSVSQPQDGDDGITETKEVEQSGVAAGRPSEPSAPAEQSVNPIPPLGRETPAEHHRQGEQPGTHSSDDDDLSIPPHLRGPSPANRRMA